MSAFGQETRIKLRNVFDRDLIWHCIFLKSAVRTSAMSNTELAPLHHDTASTTEPTGITELLAEMRAGRREAFNQMLPLVYHELRRAARRELAVRPSDSLSTTALVHELYLKFSRAERAD